MINPKRITKFDRTHEELEEFLLFCVVVAGKNAQQQALKLDHFLRSLRFAYGFETLEPFRAILLALDDNLMPFLQEAKLGQYHRLMRCFEELVYSNFDLRKVSVEDLEKVYGIGPKTARLFVLHSRPNQRLAVLDTHILKFLKVYNENKLMAWWPNLQQSPHIIQGDISNTIVPKNTPSRRTYLKLENQFLTIADKLGKLPAELDLEIWRAYAR